MNCSSCFRFTPAATLYCTHCGTERNRCTGLLSEFDRRMQERGLLGPPPKIAFEARLWLYWRHSVFENVVKPFSSSPLRWAKAYRFPKFSVGGTTVGNDGVRP